MDFGEIGWGGDVEWIHLAQDRHRWRAVVNAVMNLGVLTPRSCLLVNSYLARWARQSGPPTALLSEPQINK
jgi:hypothetical protein